MRVLVAIANHGRKNLEYLEHVLAAYREMPYEVSIVLLTDEAKNLGDDVEEIIGAPTEDPRSLPFGHRQLFADRIDDHDLFIYSEDDTLVTTDHIRAYAEVADELPLDLVPGFMRYEVRPSGERSYCSFHSVFHWEPDSVRRVGAHDVAAFTNLHAAVTIVDRARLRSAIASGGYLVGPHRLPSSMLVAAATDLYTQCGLSRVICLDRIDDFMLHHLPNVYLDKMGITTHELKLQLAALEDIRLGLKSGGRLFNTEADLPSLRLRRDYYSRPSAALSDVLGGTRGRALSVGCGTGDMERELFVSASSLTALPLDEVIAAVARDRGITTLPADFDEGLSQVADGSVDVILVHDVVKHVPNPPALLDRLSRTLAPHGRLVVTAPNLARETLRRRMGRPERPLPPRIGGFHEAGVHYTNLDVLKSWLQSAQLEMQEVHYDVERPSGVFGRLRMLDRWVGQEIVAVASPVAAPKMAA